MIENPADNENLAGVSRDSGEESPETIQAAALHARRHRRRALLATLGALVVVLVILTATGRIDSLARELLGFRSELPVEDEQVPPVHSPVAERGTFTFRDLDLHPDVLFQPYTSGPVLGDSGSPSMKIVLGFRELLDLYLQRQAVDDNFTIRAVDNRSGKLLEVFVLENAKRRYLERGSADWDEIDRSRRVETRRLVDKYAARGIPRAAVTVKWGRANQVREARERDVPFIEYEVRLARYLGLSLLSTEIGTVETFNQDWLVSKVGARSRYQMMPALLRRSGIHHYTLQAASGSKISVFEEWHPLLTMEPALVFLKGYANAVGHEIPGLSAYHAGPANIFNIYRKFLTDASDLHSSSSSVLDAYAWGVTTGFETVTKGTSFGQHSRGYVASNYGSLRATDSLDIDPSLTMRAEMVRIKPGQQLFLSQILRALEDSEVDLKWPVQVADRSVYNRFRFMNPHIVLPEHTDSLGVPIQGDVRFVSTVGTARIRFFLPIGAIDVLTASGIHSVQDRDIQRFDERTFKDDREERTAWDLQYDELVRDVSRFGFSRANRAELTHLVTRFAELRTANPSHFREVQYAIIQNHQNVWQWAQWETLANTVAAAQGLIRAPTRPVSPLGIPDPTSLRASAPPRP